MGQANVGTEEFANAFILTGPTASGKSELALQLADLLNGEIVNMDSMTLYREMDIGTAKPSKEARLWIRHHLIDVLEPWESANVAWWLQRAAEVCQEIAARGKRALIVGGTPFYLKALLHGLFPAPPADESIRHTLEQEATANGNQKLHDRLASVDARTAARLHPNDVRRVIRALEVYLLTGRPISVFQQSWNTASFAGKDAPSQKRIPSVILDLPREELYTRINERVLRMVEMGWLEEARRLFALPKPLSREATQALGYAELFEHLSSRTPNWPKTIERIQLRTRQFAKRQLTWFRSMSGLTVIRNSSEDKIRLIRQAWRI